MNGRATTWGVFKAYAFFFFFVYSFIMFLFSLSTQRYSVAMKRLRWISCRRGSLLRRWKMRWMMTRLTVSSYWLILPQCSLVNFVRKAILAFNYSITSTFNSTLTDRPAVKVKVALPLRAHNQNRPDGR